MEADDEKSITIDQRTQAMAKLKIVMAIVNITELVNHAMEHYASDKALVDTGLTAIDDINEAMQILGLEEPQMPATSGTFGTNRSLQ